MDVVYSGFGEKQSRSYYKKYQCYYILAKDILLNIISSLRRHFFKFASNAVSQCRRSTQALLTLALPSTQAAQSVLDFYFCD
jgi:predicted lactoylglutathione lyase